MAKVTGFQVRGDKGIVQIDANYRNMGLIGKMAVPHYYDRESDIVAERTALYMPKSPTSLIAFGMDPWYEDVDPLPDSEITPDYYKGYFLGDRLTQPYFTPMGRNAYDSDLVQPQAPEYWVPGGYRLNCSSYGNKQTGLYRPSSGPVPIYETVYYRDTMPTKADNINYYIYEFDFIDLANLNSKSGMQVFNGNGEVVFDANVKPMKVVGFYQAKPIFETKEYVMPVNVWKLPDVVDGHKRRYAVVALDSPGRFYNNYVSGYYDGTDYVMTSGSSSHDVFQFQKSRILHYTQGVYENIPKKPQAYLYAGMSTINYLILDVTYC